MGFLGSSVDKKSTYNVEDAGDMGSMPGLGRWPGGGHGNPVQYSCLENPVDREAWRAAVHGVTESDMTQWPALSRFTSFSSHRQSPTWPLTFLCRKLHPFTTAEPFPSKSTEWPPGLREGLKGHPTHCCHQRARLVHPFPNLDLWMCSFPFTHNQKGSGAKHILLGFPKHINNERHPKTYIWSKVFYAFYLLWQKARRN